MTGTSDMLSIPIRYTPFPPIFPELMFVLDNEKLATYLSCVYARCAASCRTPGME